MRYNRLEMSDMATKSIFTNVNIKDKKLGNALIAALEQAKVNKGKDVVLQKTYHEPRTEDIKKLFEDEA